jgi:hypothetical protein
MGEVSRLNSGASTKLEGHIMRMIVVFAVVVASIALGGCFHHSQQVYTEVPPTSIK